jgi:hypothetical protein
MASENGRATFLTTLASHRKTIVGFLIVLFVFLFYLSAMLHSLEEFGSNYTGFLRVRKQRFNKVPFLDEHPEVRDRLLTRDSGYDGQFFFFMAFDPFLSKFQDDPATYDRVVDSPQYRYGRIAFALLTNVFSFGQPEHFARTMIFLILVSHVLGSFCFLKIVRFYGRSDAWCLLYLLIPSFIVSLNLALPESIAAAFLLAGIYLYLREKIVSAAIAFALSILTRETVILFILLLSLFDVIRHRKLARPFVLCCSIVPYFLWRCFLTWRLFPEYGWETMFYTVGDFGLPLEGILQLYRERIPAPRPLYGLIFFPVLVGANLLIGGAFAWIRKNVFATGALLYSIMHICLNYGKIWRAMRSVERTTYEAFLLILLLFVSLPRESYRSIWLKLVVAVYLLVLLSYNLYLCSYSESYRAGFFFWERLF